LLACDSALWFALVSAPLPFVTRLWFSFVCALRVLADGAFARRAWAVREGMPAQPALPESEVSPSSDAPRDAHPSDVSPGSDDAGSASGVQPAAREDAALLLLAALQREGRLVDFIEQDIEDFDDADIGAAARVLHAGCRKALHGLGEVTPIRGEDEESRVIVEDGIATGEVKLVGAVAGQPPYHGILRHRGWRVKLDLPEPTADHDVSVVAPAEVEL